MHRTRRILPMLLTIAVLAMACGGSDTSTAAPAIDLTEESTIDQPASEDQGVGGDDDQSAGAPATPAPDPTPEPEPTTAPTATPVPVPPFDLVDLPSLVTTATSAVGNPVDDPLQTAVDVIGMPLAIPVPSSASLYSLEARLEFFSPGDPEARWSWVYDAVANEPVGDVDISADDNGPGAVELRATYDPIMAELGLSYSNSTGSDPGDTGGPNSINHVYDGELQVSAGGVDGAVDPVFIWLTENLTNDEASSVAGYRVDVPVSFPSEAGVIPVPVLAAIAEVFPRPDGLQISDAQLWLRSRPADSFAADFGTEYLIGRLDWVAPLDRLGELQAFYADFPEPPDGSWRAAEPDFFDETAWRPTEPTQNGDALFRGFLLADRYPARLDVQPAFGSADFAVVSLSFDLEPLRPALNPPAE